MQSLATETMHHMLSTTTAKEAWDQIQDSYAAKDTLALVMATQQFYQLQMLDQDTVEKHVTQFRINCSRLATLGTMVNDEHAAVILLASLPTSWLAFVTSQQGRANLTVAMVISAMYQHENTKRMASSSPNQGDGGLLFTQGRFQRSGKPWQNRDQGSQGFHNTNRKNSKCSYCKKSGHF